MPVRLRTAHLAGVDRDRRTACDEPGARQVRGQASDEALLLREAETDENDLRLSGVQGAADIRDITALGVEREWRRVRASDSQPLVALGEPPGGKFGRAGRAVGAGQAAKYINGPGLVREGL